MDQLLENWDEFLNQWQYSVYVAVPRIGLAVHQVLRDRQHLLLIRHALNILVERDMLPYEPGEVAYNFALAWAELEEFFINGGLSD